VTWFFALMFLALFGAGIYGARIEPEHALVWHCLGALSLVGSAGLAAIALSV
jgi:hypothetical protein